MYLTYNILFHYYNNFLEERVQQGGSRARVQQGGSRTRVQQGGSRTRVQQGGSRTDSCPKLLPSPLSPSPPSTVKKKHSVHVNFILQKISSLWSSAIIILKPITLAWLVRHGRLALLSKLFT